MSIKNDQGHALRIKNKELICTTHGRISDIITKNFDAEELLSFFPNATEREKKKFRKVIAMYQSLLDEMMDYVKDRGQAMENRLRDYRNAIEDLGFKRL